MSHTFLVTISDDEYKAFNLIVKSADQWVEDAVRNKVFACGVRVAKEHSKNPSEYLTPEDMEAIKAVMVANDDLMKTPDNWSIATLREIVSRTTMPTRAERDAAELP